MISNIDLETFHDRRDGKPLWVYDCALSLGPLQHGGSESPDVRARLVSCELNQGDRHDALSASTPPLEVEAHWIILLDFRTQAKGQTPQNILCEYLKKRFQCILKNK